MSKTIMIMAGGTGGHIDRAQPDEPEHVVARGEWPKRDGAAGWCGRVRVQIRAIRRCDHTRARILQRDDVDAKAATGLDAGVVDGVVRWLGEYGETGQVPVAIAIAGPRGEPARLGTNGAGKKGLDVARLGCAGDWISE